MELDNTAISGQAIHGQAVHVDEGVVPSNERRRSIYMSSVLATTVGMFLVAGLPCWLAFNLNWGLGMGAMSAFWGGPGYGVMVAGARVSLAERASADQVVVLASTSEPAQPRRGLQPRAA